MVLGTVLLYAGIVPGILPLLRNDLNDLPLDPSLPSGFAVTVGSATLLFMASVVFLASRGRNWARIVFLVMFVLGIPVAVAIFSDVSTWLAERPGETARIAIQTCLQAAGLACLFSRGASRWFRRRRSSRRSPLRAR